MFNKLKIRNCLFIISVFFLFNLNLFSSEQREIIVATDSWPPFRMIDKKPFTGIDFDMWEEISKRLNIKIKFEVYPWSRILHNLETGKIDAMSGVAKRKERELYVNYTAPSYYSCSPVFYLRKGEGKLINEYKDLYKYPIGYVSNSAYFDKFDNDKKLNKFGVNKEIQLLKMLDAKRINVIIGTDCQVDYDLIKLGYKDKFEKAHFKPKSSTELYIVISKKSSFSKELSKINETIKEILEENRMEKIGNKYFKK